MFKIYLRSGLMVGALACAMGAQAQQVSQRVDAPDGTPKFISFNTKADASKLRTGNAQQLLTNYLPVDQADDLRFVRSEKDAMGGEHESFHQYYQGVKVEHARYKVHSRQGTVYAINGEFEEIQQLSVRPSLSEGAALSAALAHVGASRYMWENPQQEALAAELTSGKQQSFFPKGELVIVRSRKHAVKGQENQLVLAWKFDVYAEKPLSRANIYVDAQSGEVVLKDAIIKHAAATATAATRYSGTQTMTTDSYNGSFRLRDYTRGSGIETYDCNTSTSYTSAVDFVDNDNNWTSGEWNNSAKDNAALDAHWAAQQTYDYFQQKHNRNSYDNNGAKIKSYVHYDVNYENAFWNGSVMTYGDGATRFDPLTSLDVGAHEIGHAVCEKTANLVYSYESGAMNEGFSDIWGASVEYFAAPSKQTWLIGEDIDKQRPSLRSMSNPKAEGQPDTYKGTNWYTGSGDNGGVHYNSGVLNHWFYILSVGKSGTNDIGTSYSVSGIGIDNAAKIAYRTESVYLSANSQYADARTYAIQAAEDLFGAGSNEVVQTTNAWNAVGIGGKYGEITYCTSQGNNSSYEWIAGVQIGSFSKTSGAAGYSDFTGTSVTLSPGANYSLSLTPGFSGTTYNEYWKIWIDYNKDGDFSDAGEEVFNSGALSKTTVSGSMTVASSASGTTRMRVSMKYNGAQTACESFSYGEVEDYTVSFGGTPPSCNLPASLSASSVTSSSATLNWGAVTNATSYNVRYRVNGTSTWTNTTSTSTSKAISGLAASTTYEFQVATVCSSGTSAYSSSATFATSAAVCNVPSSLSTSGVSSSGATLNWGAVSGATSYGVRYRVSGTSTWTNTTSTSTSKAISGLAASTTYEWQVNTTCSSGSSAYSSSASFTTSSGSLSYCVSKGNNSSYEWIDLVQFGGINNVTGNNGGYADFTSQTGTVARGSSNTIYISCGFASSSYTEYWRIYIDFNQDGDFTDAGEQVVSGSSSSSGTLSATITVPSTASLGTTRMRVSMKYNAYQTPCETFSYGEVEDYTLNITNTVAGIAGPVAATASETLGNVAGVEFAAYPNPVSNKLKLLMPGTAATVRIINATGAVMLDRKLNANERELDVAALPAGMYVIQLSDGQKEFTQRLIKN